MAFAPYPAYEEADAAWLPIRPKHWDVASLRWLARRYAGGTPDKGNEAYWEDGDIPWLNSGAVNNGYITEPSEFITREGFLNSSAKWIPRGALVMALAGQGRTKGMVAQLGIESTCNQSMAAIVPTQRMRARFLFWWLTANYQNIRNMAGGEARDGLNLDLLGDIPCPIPPDGEQAAITALLDRETAKIDALVAKKRTLIERLKEQRTALISRTVTRGLPSAAAHEASVEPDPKLKPSGIDWLGNVPEHWSTWKATHGFRRIGSGTTPKSDDAEYYDGDVPWVTTSELREALLTDTAAKVTAAALRDYTALRLYPKGTLLVAMYGATIGRLGILGLAATVNQACAAFAEPLKLDTWFTYYWLQMRRPTLIALSAGGGQPNLSQDDLRQLRIPAPPLHEQSAIADFLDRETAKIDGLVGSVETAIERLQEYRMALITAAVTGKIDVREALK